MSIQLTVEVQEAQFILNAIADQPFKQVADLWFKIKSQAEQQVRLQQASTPIEAEPADTPQAEA